MAREPAGERGARQRPGSGQHPVSRQRLVGGYLNRTSSEIAADFICGGRAVSQIRK
jgi:hypothetical protein